MSTTLDTLAAPGRALAAPRTISLRCYLALAGAVVALGVSAILVRMAGAPAAPTSFYRMATAVLVMAWPFWRRVRARGGLPLRAVAVAALAGLLFAADLALWTTGVLVGGATAPTLLANTAPLWVGLGATVLFGERLGAGFWGGLAVALAGSAALLGVRGSLGLGALLGLLAGAFYGSYILATERSRRTLGALESFWPAAVASAFALCALALVTGQPLSGYPARTWWLFLAMGLVTQVGGYMLVNYALGHLPASLVSPSLLGQPVVTALLAWTFLGESLSPLQIVAGLGVLGGVLTVHASRGRRGA
jgi:drug/metabolite transporter (DMT)-like permease